MAPLPAKVPALPLDFRKLFPAFYVPSDSERTQGEHEQVLRGKVIGKRSGFLHRVPLRLQIFEEGRVRAQFYVILRIFALFVGCPFQGYQRRVPLTRSSAFLFLSNRR